MVKAKSNETASELIDARIDALDEKALKALIRAAAALNKSSARG